MRVGRIGPPPAKRLENPIAESHQYQSYLRRDTLDYLSELFASFFPHSRPEAPEVLQDRRGAKGILLIAEGDCCIDIACSRASTRAWPIAKFGLPLLDPLHRA